MQSSKSLEAIVAFAGQAGGLLSNKQVEQVQNMIDKCLNCIQDYDKSSYIRLLTAFLRLFLLVPVQAVEPFMFRYYSLLREWLPQKYRMQDRLDALVNALIEVADKHLLSCYQQIKNSRSVQPSDNIPVGNPKAGIALNFKSFLNLFRKAIDKEKDYRSSQCISVIKEAYFRLIQQLSAPPKTNGKLTNNFTLKLHIIGVFYSVVTTRYESQTAHLIKQTAEDFMLKDGKNESALFLLMRINERDVSACSIIVQVMDQWIKVEKSNQESSNIASTYEIDTVLSALILVVLCDLSEERNIVFFKALLALAIRTSSLLSMELKNSVIMSFSEFTSINYEKLIIDLHSRINYHQSTRESSKHSPSSILSSLSKQSSLLNLNLFENDSNNQGQQSLQSKTRQNSLLNTQTKAHIFSMIWRLSENEHSTMSRDNLCSSFKLLNGQQQIGTEDWKKFIKQMCIGFGLPFTYQDYCNSQAIYSDSQSTVSPISQLQQIINSNLDMSDSDVTKILSEAIDQLSKSRFCLQDLVDLIGEIISKQEETEATFKLPSQFYSLSLVLFDKINLKPAMPEAKKQQLSFNNKRNQTHIRRLIILIGQIYLKDVSLRRNGWFQSSLAECGNDKIAVAAVRKWLGVKIGRINEAMVYGWIIRRDFILLWSMLLCNYKVKLICEQLLRSGIPSRELTAFISIEDVLVREFIEFLAGKERYRLRLALWELNLTERQYLLDCSLTELLLKC